MRFAGALLLIAPVSLFLFERLKRLKRRAAALNGFFLFFSGMREACGWLYAEMPRLLRLSAPAGFSFPQRVLSGYAESGDLGAAWNDAVNTDPAEKTLTETERAGLLRFAAVFDSALPQTLESVLTSLSERFGAAARQAQKLAAAQSRYWLGLGAMGAALILILVW